MSNIFMGGGINTGDTDIDEILDRLDRWYAGIDEDDDDYLDPDMAKAAIEQKLREIEKAYGGCRNCYGKGFATARIGTSSRYGNVTHDTIKYCACDRGKQLEALTVKKLNEARIDELERLHRYDGKDYDTEIDEIIDERIAELQATKDEPG